MVGVPLILEILEGMKEPYPIGSLLPQTVSEVYLKTKQNITGT